MDGFWFDGHAIDLPVCCALAFGYLKQEFNDKHLHKRI